MSADAGVFLVLAVNHRHRVPANQGLNTSLHFAIAWVGQLLLDGNRVLVRSVELSWRLDARFARPARKRLKQFAGSTGTLFLNNLIKRLKPLGNLAVVRFHRLGRRNWVRVHNYHDITWLRPPSVGLLIVI